MGKDERKVFERMSRALEETNRTLERVADVMEKQQPSKATQALTTVVAVATVSGILSAIDLVIKWITGG
jgi:hypothetical protein